MKLKKLLHAFGGDKKTEVQGEQKFYKWAKVRMLDDIRNIDTYGISPSFIKNNRKTIFKIRKVHEDETGQYALRFCNLYTKFDEKSKTYAQEIYDDCSLAYWNPKMFKIVE